MLTGSRLIVRKMFIIDSPYGRNTLKFFNAKGYESLKLSKLIEKKSILINTHTHAQSKKSKSLSPC